MSRLGLEDDEPEALTNGRKRRTAMHRGGGKKVANVFLPADQPHHPAQRRRFSPPAQPGSPAEVLVRRPPVYCAHDVEADSDAAREQQFDGVEKR